MLSNESDDFDAVLRSCWLVVQNLATGQKYSCMYMSEKKTVIKSRNSSTELAMLLE
jgi:hypothetical protein